MQFDQTEIKRIKFIGNSKDDYYYRSNESYSINLLDDSDQLNILEYIPRLFKLTTNNSSGTFNTDLLSNTSTVIAEFIKNNPNILQYHLDINDESNVLKKFEQMYQNKLTFFEEDELPISKKITKILNIQSCPNYLKPESLKTKQNPEKNELNDGVRICEYSLSKYLENQAFRTFSIITKNNEYKCNRFGIYCSKILREIVLKDPTITKFEYNFNDSFKEFQSICDIFNFKTVKITINNIDSIKEITDDLQIDILYDKLNKSIDNYENISKKIDEKQKIVDSIENLFDLLFNIDKYTVETVKDSIIESQNWIDSDDNVRELAAIILRVINISSKNHLYIIELIKQLDKEANESNSLNILISFIVDRVMRSFGNNLYNCSFVYSLWKEGIITKEIIIKGLEDRIKEKTVSLFMWFLPEIIELNLFDEYFKNYGGYNPYDYGDWKEYIQRFYPNEIELYKKIRDENEPDDLITRSIRKDDIDTFQSIISKSEIDISNAKIPFNMFEKYIANGKTNYINYASTYGAIKCFKYLLLNHVQIDNETFKYAVLGGNIEIIKIVDQNFKGINEDCRYYYNTAIANLIAPSIIKHQNSLFDWILEHRILNEVDSNEFDSNNVFKSIFYISARNGNAHSFIEMIDKGIDFSEDATKIISTAAKKGFYQLVQLIYNFINVKSDNLHFYTEHIKSFVSSGNLSIFKFYLQLKHDEIESPFYTAIENKCTSIIKYYFENIIKEGQFKINRTIVFRALDIAIEKRFYDIFIYLINCFNNINLYFFNHPKNLDDLLIKVCQNNNFEIAKITTNLIIKHDKKFDFTQAFLTAAKLNKIEICKYFIDEKVYISIDSISSELNKFKSLNHEILMYLIDNCEINEKRILKQCLLYPAIMNHDKILIEYLLKNNVAFDNALFDAVKCNNLEIVDLILNHNCQPYFINKKTRDGTALHAAIENGNLQIVQRLLSIKGIDLNLYDSHHSTPLIAAALKNNLDIFNAILDFYNDNIQSQKSQLDNATTALLDSIYFYDLKKSILPILKRILEFKNINPNCHGKEYSLLSYSCTINEIDFVKILIKKDKIDLNAYSSANGDTPLMIAIDKKNEEIAKMLIEDKRTNINIRNFENETALTYAAKKNLSSTINLLINNEKFDHVESNLNYAFFISTGESSKILSTLKLLDVNYELFKQSEYKYFNQRRQDDEKNEVCICQTALTKATELNDFKKVDLIINHPSFNKNKSRFKIALLIAIYNKNFEIFQKLMSLENNDVNIYIHKTSLLNIAIENCSKEIVISILNNQNFDSEKSDIYYAFIKGVANMSIERKYNYQPNINNAEMLEILELLLEYDKQHKKLININKLLPSGKSYFTSIYDDNFNYNSYIDFFVKHGYNFNVPDKFDIYPLEQAIFINSSDFFAALINTNRIDFNIKIPNPSDLRRNNKNVKFTTYIHLAIRNDNTKIVSLLLNTNMIDINITDDLDDTPLMEACRYKLKNMIELFVDFDNLDYLHRNKNGEDALQILNPEIKEKFEDKNEYFAKLMNKFEDKNQYNHNDFYDDDDDDYFHFNDDYP